MIWLGAITLAVGSFAGQLPRNAVADIQTTDSQPPASTPWPAIDVFHQRASASSAAPAAGWQLVSLRLSAPAGAILAQRDGGHYPVLAGDQLPGGLRVLAINTDGVQIDDGQGPRWLQLPQPTRLIGNAATSSELAASAAATAPNTRSDTAADGWVVPAGSPHSAALALAGLRPGDRLLRINNRPVTGDGHQLTSLLRRGQTLQLQWLRDGQPDTRAVRIP